MMKRLLLAIAFLATSSAASFAATCSAVSPQLKDNAGTTFNAPYVDDGTGSGDCVPKVSLLSVAVTAALNGTPSLANGNGVVPTQGGAVLSATNGMFTNVLQGNAVLSLTNPLFVTPATSASWAVTGTFYQASQATSLASGQVASGAFASGAFATGSGTDGWNVTEGTKADAAWTSGSGSLVAVGKAIATAAVAPVPCLNATAQNTNTYTTGSTSPTNCDVNSNLYVNLGKNNGTAGTPSTAVLSTQGVSGGYPLSVTTNNAYPYGITPVNATATGTTAATTATIAGSGGAAFTFLCGFSIRANATAAATGNATVTGATTATLNFTQWTAPLASGIGIVEQVFTPCLSSSAANTAIAVVSAAPGSGGTVSVTAWGYYQ